MFASQKYLLRLNIFFISLFLLPFTASSQPAKPVNNLTNFPFLAEINQDKINVRAGQSTGFEKLCQMNKGDEVIVYEQSFSWCKIKLPKRCPAYISEKYVEKIGLDKGKITGSHVNIRAGANAESSSLGMIAKDGEIKILSKKDGWYKIEPDEHAFGWLAGQFVAFKSNDISLYHEPVVENSGKIDLSSSKIIGDDKSIPQNVIDVSGTLEKSDVMDAGIPYRITQDGKVQYYLKTSQPLFESFVGNKVSVKGVQIESQSNLSAPLLDLYQVRLNY